MFIYHFNRLIRNRLLWLLFAILVAFAFLSVDSCVRGFGSGDSSSRSAGRLAGRAVDAERYRFADLFVRGVGRNRNDALPPSLVETQIWQHLAAVQTAAELGLTSSADEIRQSIREVPSFAVDGRFDAGRYRQVIGQSLGITPGVYERLMADQIALQKVVSSTAAAAWVSPMELDDEVAAWTDQLEIRFAVVSNRFAEAAIDIGDEALRAFYDEHEAAFALPERVGVHYAAVSISNYLQSVTVPDEDVEEHYDSNANRYTRVATNDTIETLPLAEVRASIVAELAGDEARFAASTNAAAFIEQLGLADVKEFTWRAKARGLAVLPSPLFAAEEPVPGIDEAAQAEFREAAFDLDPARTDTRFAVVRGDSHVYILQAWTNSPAHTPAFAAVRDRVVPMAQAQARDKAFESQLGDIRAAVAAAVTNGQAFAAAAAAQGLNVSTSLTFSAHSVSRSTLPYSYALLPAAMRLRAGEVSEPARLVDGAALVYMESRQPADPLAMEMVRPQLREAIARRRGSALATDWMRWNLERLGFAPANGPATAGDDGGEEAAAGDEES